jgi:hypothetical protein
LADFTECFDNSREHNARPDARGDWSLRPIMTCVFVYSF